MIKSLFFDAFSAIFVFILFASNVFFAGPALSSTGMPPVHTLQEKWTARPVYDFSRNLWGQIEGVFFHQARKGVLIGDDRWLLRNGGCPAATVRNLDANMDYVTAARNLLAERNTTLLVVLIPAKERIHSGTSGMSPCRRAYGKALAYMDRHRIPVTDLRPATGEVPEQDAFLPRDNSTMAADALKIRNGDLLRNVLGVQSSKPPLIQVADAGSSMTDATSAASSRLEEFLKEALRTDLLNVTQQGQGPFTAMDVYLRDAAWANNPPDVLVWEIPESYLLIKRGVRRL